MSNSTQEIPTASNGTTPPSTCIPLGPKECYPGLYCPNVNISDPATYPQKCQESPECAASRLLGERCAPNQFSPYGAQGKYEPVLCPKGNFCKTPATVEPCPRGYFCPSGTYQPTKCDFFALCPEGSIQQKSFTGLVSAGGLDIILLLLCFLQWRFDRFRIANQSTAPLVSVVGEKAPAEKTTVAPGNDVQEALVGSFRKSMNGKDLKMDFRVENLNYTLPTGKAILQGVSGEIKAGRMTAIVGPSGAGKTTFMNVLCGKVDRTSGKLFISGKEVELAAFKKIYGFVPQEDVMHRELTVRENILHSARIRLPKSWTSAEVEKHVDNVLKALNLSHVAQSPIGDGVARGVSGGQRKRVNIGIELAATPLCLCLDEPTSGLDSTAALEVADTLSKITKLGMTIIAVIHQPRIEIFQKFDDVLMIVPGGRTAYFGPTSEARGYFEKMGFRFVQGANDSDTLMDILSGAGDNANGEYTVNELVERWENRVIPPQASSDSESQETITHQDASTQVKRTPSAARRLSQSIMEKLHLGTYILKEDEHLSEGEREFHQQAATLVAERGASFMTQFYYATALSILQQYRSIVDLVLEIAVGLAAGLLMGMALSGYDEIYVGVMKAPFTSLSPAPVFFLTPLFTMLVALSIALGSSPAGTKVFSEEIEIYWRNASSGHSPLAYYLGKTLATFPRIFLVGTHFAGIVFYMSGPVIPFYINLFMIGFIFYGIYGLCAFVSMCVNRQNATLLSVIFTLFYGVFCGFGPTLVDAKKWGLMWIWWLSFNMWANEAYYGQTVRFYDGVYNSDLINEVFGFTFDQTFFDIAMMAVIGCVWRVFAYFAMINFNKQHQR